MPTLHQATKLTKNFFKFGGLLVFLVIAFIVIFNGGKFIKELIKPTPPPPPTVSFGKLPEVEFPVSLIKKQFTYSLDTVTGTLPKFPDRAKVSKITYPSSNLLALKRAQSLVSKVGFNSEAFFIADNRYRWFSNEPFTKNITFDILSFNFKLSSNFIINESILKGLNLPNEDQAIKQAQSFLSDLSATPNDLDEGKTKTTLFSIKDFEIVPTTSLSTAQLIRVDFYQKDVDNLPIFYPNPPSSTMNLFVAGGKYNGQVVTGDFFHQNISTESATYPIKTAEEAFSLLKKGEAFIATYYGNENNISIKNVFLGYFLGETQQEYLLPIIVFEGNNGFYAYIEAIKDEWLKK